MRPSIFSRKRVLLACIFALLSVGLNVMAAMGQSDSPTPEMETLVAGNNAFAFDLYAQIAATHDGENLLFSPYSISQALAMAYAGGRGNTEAQMAEVLHFDLGQEVLHSTFNALTTDLQSRADEPIPMVEDGQRLQLNIANAIWGQDGYPFRAEYLDLLDQTYAAPLRLVDFRADPEGARELVNAWVEDETEEKIKDIVPPNTFNEATRLVLANAIYFNASWATIFPEFLTSDQPFFLLDDTEITVSMMNSQERRQYASGEGYQTVAVPYLGGDMAMLLFVPDSGAFAEFEASFTPEMLNATIASMEMKTVNLSLPRFTYGFAVGLGDALRELGMGDAFAGGLADFTGIYEPEGDPLFISDVLHKAFIAVDEEGTEAAAATVVTFEATTALMPTDIVELKIDRPFIYAIYDFKTGSVLFMGRVLNPSVTVE